MKNKFALLVMMPLIAGDTYYIEWPVADHPITISHGNSRTDAVANSGVTVWTEKEWKEGDMDRISREIEKTKEQRLMPRAELLK